MSNIEIFVSITGKKPNINKVLGNYNLKDILYECKSKHFEKDKIIKFILSENSVIVSVKIKILNKISIDNLNIEFFNRFNKIKETFYEKVSNIKNNQTINYTKNYNNTILF